MEFPNIKISQRMKQIMVYTLFFVVLTHGYRYFQTDFSHDSIAFGAAKDVFWKISLGRFTQPLYWMLRGKTGAPFVIGVFSYIWLVPSIGCVADVLKIRSNTGLLLLSGVMAGSIATVAANATYIHEADTFLLALLFNVLAARLSLKGGLGPSLGAVLLIAVGAGLYQAYAQVYAVLVMIWAIRIILAEELPLRKTWLRCMGSAAVLLAGIGLYLIINWAVLAYTGIQPESGYNGLTTLGDYKETNLLQLAIWTWLHPIYYYIRLLPGRMGHFYAVVHLAVLAYGGCLMLYLIRKKKMKFGQWASVLAIAALLPIGMNCMYPISKGLTHELIMYAYSFAQIWVIATAEYAGTLISKENGAGRTRRLLRQALPIMLCILFATKAIWSNQQYLKKDLENDSTQAVMIRILDRMEQLEGYRPEQNPVHFIGTLGDSPLIAERPGFKRQSSLTGSWFASALTFDDQYWTFWNYFEDVLGYPILPYKGQMSAAQTAVAEQMSPFPAKDSVQMVDGLVLIKLS